MRKLFLILMTVIAYSLSLSAQNHTIHGTVLDAANNEPLIGATIMPIGGGQGAAADIDGNFTLNVPANVKKATISYVGYTSQTVELKNKMVVRLASSATNLNDVIVVAYGTANKESLTGSVAVVGAGEIEDRPVTTVTAALEGNAPGVQVSNTYGQPGSDPSIRIRGFNSVNGNNDPIYVVDGVPYQGSISSLNPQDIESMSILKDAASAALYGNKGANGVVLITTKKAKKQGKVDVNFTLREGLYTRAMPEYDRLGAKDWMTIMMRGNVNSLLSSGNYDTYADALEYGKQSISNIVQQNIFNGEFTDLYDANGQFTGEILPGYTDLNWWDAIKQTGMRQEYNLNAAGATEKFNVFASIGYLKENGYIQCSDFERFTGRINATFEPTTYLRFGANMNSSIQKSEVGQFSDTGSALNPFLVQSMAPVYSYYRHNEDGSIMYDADGQPMWNKSGAVSGNVAYIMRLNQSSYKNQNLEATVYGTAIIPYGFEFTVRGALARLTTTSLDYTNNVAGDGLSFNGRLYNDAGVSKYYTLFQTLNWSHDYGVNHVDVLLDHENYAYDSSYFYLQMTDQSFANILYMSNFNKYEAASGSKSQDRTESYLGRVRYDYNQKYFGEVSLRRDGTSRFAKNNRWGTFLAGGASWIISKEKFLQSVHQINYLKLRAAYGAVGNCNSAGFYSYWPLYATGQIGQIPFLGLAQVAANDVRWEATRTFDVALEGTLFNNRLNFSVGYFDKRNVDLLFNVYMPASMGIIATNPGYLQKVLTNVGTMSNRGWELSFNGDIINNKDFKWSASIDATFLKNKIVKLPDNKDISMDASNRRLSEGHALYEFYAYHFAGVDQMTGNSLYTIDRDDLRFKGTDGSFNQEEWDNNLLLAEEAKALVKIGDQYYTTNTGYASRGWRGTAIPTVFGSFGTDLKWKGLNLGLLFTYSLGGKFYDSLYAGLMSVGNVASAIHVDNLKSWNGVPEGMTEDSPNRIDPKGIPVVNFERNQDNNGQSDRWFTSASYLCLKNINVSYDLPQKWVKPLQLQNINLGISIDNLFTVTARKGLNPQVSWAGTGNSYTFTTPRVFTFQLQARF